jgi:hypothetical protein
LQAAPTIEHRLTLSTREPADTASYQLPEPKTRTTDIENDLKPEEWPSIDPISRNELLLTSELFSNLNEEEVPGHEGVVDTAAHRLSTGKRPVADVDDVEFKD